MRLLAIIKAEWLDDSFGEPGVIGFGGKGGVEGALLEEVDDEGEITLEKVVAEDGADMGSSSEIKLAPSSTLSGSTIEAEGTMAALCSDGWLSDQGDFSGGGGWCRLPLRDGDDGTDGGCETGG